MSYKIINTTLIFSYNFNKILDEEIIQIMNLCDTIYFSNYITGIKCIKTQNFYNADYDKYWMDSIFNKSVNNLSNSIKYITFGYCFNQPINNLPSSIIYLSLCGNFNKNVDNLPSSIIYLILGCNFNQCIDNLPNSVIYLKIGNKFNQNINNLPYLLKEIKISKYNNNYLKIKKKINTQYPKCELNLLDLE